MGWDKVGVKGGGDSLPIVKIDKPTRLRLIEGPGKYAEPQDRWQHWAEGEAAKHIKGPVGCIGARQGCIFHVEPLKFRTSKQFVMNCIVYETDAKGNVTGSKIAVLSGNQIFEQMKNQCTMVNADPTAIDWLVGKTGTGKQTTYTVSMVPGGPIDGNIPDLSRFESQGDLAAEENPKLVDFDKFDGFRKRTPAEQQQWYEDQMAAAEPSLETEDAAAATPAAPVAARPAAPAFAAPPVPATVAPKPKITMPPKAAPKLAPPAPKPAPKPAAPSLDQLKAAADPWGEKTFGELDAETLTFIANTDGFTDEHKQIASTLLNATSAAPAAAPAVSNGAATLDEAAMRTELGEIIKSSAILKGFPNMKKFFTLAGNGDKKALAALDGDELAQLLDIARQGDDVIAQAIA